MDGYSFGASVFFDVAYKDVTPQQRAVWKLTTFGMRQQPVSSIDVLNAARSL
jgi:hypothetical protein